MNDTGGGGRPGRSAAVTMVAIVVGLFVGALTCSAEVGGGGHTTTPAVAEPTHGTDHSSHDRPGVADHDPGSSHRHSVHLGHHDPACLVDIRLVVDPVAISIASTPLKPPAGAAPVDACSRPEPPVPRAA
ncbi:MAG: hypothetical protein R2697_21495 [Ilumatobacteraceae bacterium]